MANLLLPPEERNLTPDQVEALTNGATGTHVAGYRGQFAVIATSCCSGSGRSDLLAGWAHPIAYYLRLRLRSLWGSGYWNDASQGNTALD